MAVWKGDLVVIVVWNWRCKVRKHRGLRQIKLWAMRMWAHEGMDRSFRNWQDGLALQKLIDEQERERVARNAELEEERRKHQRVGFGDRIFACLPTLKSSAIHVSPPRVRASDLRSDIEYVEK